MAVLRDGVAAGSGGKMRRGGPALRRFRVVVRDGLILIAEGDGAGRWVSPTRADQAPAGAT